MVQLQEFRVQQHLKIQYTREDLHQQIMVDILNKHCNGLELQLIKQEIQQQDGK